MSRQVAFEFRFPRPVASSSTVPRPGARVAASLAGSTWRGRGLAGSTARACGARQGRSGACAAGLPAGGPGPRPSPGLLRHAAWWPPLATHRETDRTRGGLPRPPRWCSPRRERGPFPGPLRRRGDGSRGNAGRRRRRRSARCTRAAFARRLPASPGPVGPRVTVGPPGDRRVDTGGRGWVIREKWGTLGREGARTGTGNEGGASASWGSAA